MKTPIIVNDPGAILVFASKSDVESYIEPIDVRVPLVAFDAEGRLLEVHSKNMGGLQHTKVIEMENIPTHQDELRELLIAYFMQVNLNLLVKNKLNSCSLAELIDISRAFIIK